MRGAFIQLLVPLAPVWVGRKRCKRPENQPDHRHNKFAASSGSAAVYCPLSRSADFKYHPRARCHVRARPKQIGRQK